MTVSISIRGSKELRAALEGMGDSIRDEMQRVVLKTAVWAQGNIVEAIQRGPASGRTYRRGGVVHTASSPGEPPMSDTGRLAGSVRLENEGPLTATVGSPLVYAAYLEYGTRKMAPRPIWRKTAFEAEEQFERAAAEAMTRLTR